MAKKWSTFTTKTNVTATDYIMGLDPTAVSLADRNVRIPATSLAFQQVKIITTATYTVVPEDNRTLLLVTGAFTTTTITIPAGSTLTSGFTFGVTQNSNDDARQVVVVPSASNQINYFTIVGVGLNQTVGFLLQAATDVANISTFNTSGIGQDLYLVYNTNIDSYTLRQKDNGQFSVFPASGDPKTLTLPANASVNLPKGFWTQAYNPGSVAVTISTTDTIEGATSIPPNYIAHITKRSYGIPNVWVVNVVPFSAASLTDTNAFTNTTDSSSSATGAMTIAGGLGIAKKLYVGTGIYLPTATGTASELNYYEDSGNITISFTGPFSGDMTAKFIRIGKQVIFHWQDFTGTSTTGAKLSGAVPQSRWYPQSNINSVAYIGPDNGTTVQINMTIQSTGMITIGVGITQANYQNTGTAGIYGGSLSWTLA